jgi:hypothetical protein
MALPIPPTGFSSPSLPPSQPQSSLFTQSSFPLGPVNAKVEFVAGASGTGFLADESLLGGKYRLMFATARPENPSFIRIQRSTSIVILKVLSKSSDNLFYEGVLLDPISGEFKIESVGGNICVGKTTTAGTPGYLTDYSITFGTFAQPQYNKYFTVQKNHYSEMPVFQGSNTKYKSEIIYYPDGRCRITIFGSSIYHFNTYYYITQDGIKSCILNPYGSTTLKCFFTLPFPNGSVPSSTTNAPVENILSAKIPDIFFNTTGNPGIFVAIGQLSAPISITTDAKASFQVSSPYTQFINTNINAFQVGGNTYILIYGRGSNNVRQIHVKKLNPTLNNLITTYGTETVSSSITYGYFDYVIPTGSPGPAPRSPGPAPASVPKIPGIYEYPPTAMTSTTNTINGITYTASTRTIGNGQAYNVYNKDLNSVLISGSSSYNSLGQPSNGPWWTQLQFSTPVAINRYDMWNEMISQLRSPKDIYLEGSIDGRSWVRLHSITGLTWSSAPHTFRFQNSTAYSYYRLSVGGIVTPNLSTVSIAEIKYYEEIPDPVTGVIPGSTTLLETLELTGSFTLQKGITSGLNNPYVGTITGTLNDNSIIIPNDYRYVLMSINPEDVDVIINGNNAALKPFQILRITRAGTSITLEGQMEQDPVQAGRYIVPFSDGYTTSTIYLFLSSPQIEPPTSPCEGAGTFTQSVRYAVCNYPTSTYKYHTFIMDGTQYYFVNIQGAWQRIDENGVFQPNNLRAGIRTDNIYYADDVTYPYTPVSSTLTSPNVWEVVVNVNQGNIRAVLTIPSGYNYASFAGLKDRNCYPVFFRFDKPLPTMSGSGFTTFPGTYVDAWGRSLSTFSFTPFQSNDITLYTSLPAAPTTSASICAPPPSFVPGPAPGQTIPSFVPGPSPGQTIPSFVPGPSPGQTIPSFVPGPAPGQTIPSFVPGPAPGQTIPSFVPGPAPGQTIPSFVPGPAPGQTIPSFVPGPSPGQTIPSFVPGPSPGQTIPSFAPGPSPGQTIPSFVPGPSPGQTISSFVPGPSIVPGPSPGQAITLYQTTYVSPVIEFKKVSDKTSKIVRFVYKSDGNGYRILESSKKEEFTYVTENNYPKQTFKSTNRTFTAKTLPNPGLDPTA